MLLVLCPGHSCWEMTVLYFEQVISNLELQNTRRIQVKKTVGQILTTELSLWLCRCGSPMKFIAQGPLPCFANLCQNFRKLQVIVTSVTVPSACFSKASTFPADSLGLPLVEALKF